MTQMLKLLVRIPTSLKGPCVQSHSNLLLFVDFLQKNNALFCDVKGDFNLKQIAIRKDGKSPD